MYLCDFFYFLLMGTKAGHFPSQERERERERKKKKKKKVGEKGSMLVCL